MKSRLLGKRIHASTWQAWLGQWAELLQSGMPVLDALQLSSELQAGSRQGLLLQQGLAHTLRFLNQGQDFQTAFRAVFGQIPQAMEVSLLCAQASGDLCTAISQQLERWRLTSEATSKLMKSLVYPTVVLVAAVSCWALLHFISKPHLGDLPTPASQHGYWSNAMLLGGALLLLLALLLKQGKKAQGNSSANLLARLSPAQSWARSAYFHLLACELQAGLDLMHCLRYRTIPSRRVLACLDLTGPAIIQLNQMTFRVQQSLKQGNSLSKAMQDADAPQFLVRQSQLAEQTGNLAQCFLLAAKVYEIQARDMQNRLQNILPALALALAALTLALAYQFTLAPLYNNLAGLA